MTWLDRLMPWRQKSANSYDILRELLGRRTSHTGKVVSVNTAIQVATVFACARVIAEGIAQVPLKLIQENADASTRMPAKAHPLYDLLACKPNAWQTSFEYREMLAWHVVLCGNAYSYINRARTGQILELIPFEPGKVTPRRDTAYKLTYEVLGIDGQLMTFQADQIWHVKGPSWNSWCGMEAVSLAREAIGLAMATEEQHARMHKNGVKNSGVYSIEGTLKADQYEALQKWIDQQMAGLENSGKAMILDRSATWLNTSMTGVDSQHLETRRFQIEEVCRFFRVMPIMVGYSDKAATYASAEQMFLAHVVHTLSPWYQRLEQSIDANLLSEKDRAAGYYAQFVEEGLLRGDSKSTAEFLTKLTTNGIMTRNEARAKLDMNPLDGLDDPLTPVNMQIGTDPQGESNAN